MTKDQVGHITRVLMDHTELTYTKYEAGQIEHQGNCWEKPGMLAHGLDEVADLTVYFHTAKEQCEQMAAALRAGEASAVDAADFLDRLWTK